MRDLLLGRVQFASQLRHIWWGVSVDDRRFGLPRVDQLRESGAAMKFLSVEPLLEDLGGFDFTGLDWVIVGGESGPHARPMPAEGFVPSATTACPAKSPSFSSSGAAFGNTPPVVSSMAGRGMNFPRANGCRFRPWPCAGN